MTDIVERLREWAKVPTYEMPFARGTHHMYDALPAPILNAAADEIEKLRAALRQAIDYVYWMSAASDFGPDGKAHKGWVKVRDDAMRLETVLRDEP